MRPSGTRDTTSIWLKGGAERSRVTLAHGDVVDVAVVGGGIAGLMVADALVEDGHRVAVVEAKTIGSGVSGSSTAKVTALHGQTYHRLARHRGRSVARWYAVANQLGVEDYDRIVTRDGIDCGWRRLPSFTYTTDAAKVPSITNEHDAASEAGLAVTLTDDVDLPFRVAAAVRCENQAMLDPVRFLRGLATSLERRGVAIYEGSPVAAIEEGPSGAQVVRTTDGGEQPATSVVLATQLPVVDPGRFFAKTSPVRSYALAATLAGEVPDGMFLSIDEPTRSIRPVGGADATVILGGGSHRVGAVVDTEAYYRDLEGWARTTFDVARIEATWSAQDLVPVDDVPFIGRMPHGRPRTFVATGFKKWGFTTAAVAARVISDLVAGRDNRWLEAFDAERIPHDLHSLGETLLGNAKVAEHFVGDRLRTMQNRPVEQLELGEGRIVDVDGTKAAAYRDPDGALHVRSARCTHLGCVVAWNDAERSWDCPCHGSRFGVDGAVITGPAIEPLAPIDGA